MLFYFLLVTALVPSSTFIHTHPLRNRYCAIEALRSTESSESEYVTVEVQTRSVLVESSSKKSEEVAFIGYQSLYEEVQENRMQRALVENPVLKVLGLLFNPTTLLFAMYFSGIAWSKVLWLQKLLSIFGKGSLKDAGTEPVKELPYQIFECESCKMELRPARGRAEAIFGKPRFRCSK
jgi:hypothetical protein